MNPLSLLSSADHRLIRRLEVGHADSGVAYARAYLKKFPDSGVAVEQIAGGWAIFQGPESPQTQALAIGTSGVVTPQELAHLERFYHSRGAAAVIDLSSMADASVLSLVQREALTIREISNVLARRVDRNDDFASHHQAAVESMSEEETQEWAHLVIRGFTNHDEIPQEQVDIAAVMPPQLCAYFARLNEARVAAAAMIPFEGLATFVGDVTLPVGRRTGLQFALIMHRLRVAAAMGCDLASVSVVPGSTSHRNYERAGFQLISSRLQIAIPCRVSPGN